jgi:putative adhesin
MKMTRHQKLVAPIALLTMAVALAGCSMGPSVSGSFDRSLDVSGPIRLELGSVSGDVSIVGSADGKVHVHGDVRVSGVGFGSPQKRLDDLVSSPPIELKGDTLRIGKDTSRLHNVSISYAIEVPRDTAVNSSGVSGSQIFRNLRGPVQAFSVSGTVRGQDIGRELRLSSTSGTVTAENCGDDVRATSVSGNVTVTNAKGDVLAHSVSGDVHVQNPGGRVDADTSSGTVDVRDANGDVKAHATAGRVTVKGNPSGNAYWDLKTVSGSVDIGVPSSASFHLSAGAVTGQIRAQVPIMIEEQGKHSLRAHMGDGGGRVEIHTVSGAIEVLGAQ